MIEYILPPIWCAIADRVRGGFPDSRMWPVSGKPEWVDHVRHAVKFTYGMALVLPFTTTWWHVLLAGATWKFGEQIASDFGGTFRLIAGKDEWLWPLIRVGATWPLATIVAVAYWEPTLSILLATSVAACVGSALAAKRIGYSPRVPAKLLQLTTPGAWQEALRGFINGLLAVAAGAVLA